MQFELHDTRNLGAPSTTSSSNSEEWRQWLVIVAGFSFLLLCASVLQDVLFVGRDKTSKIWMLDVDVEQSIFTWVSVLAFFFAAQLLFWIGREKFATGDRFRWHWCFLAAVFLMLSLDEFSSLHEKVSAVLARQFDNTGVFYFAWAAPAGVLSLLGLAAFIPFIRSFPPRHGRLLLLSALIFLFGAVGMEMIGGAIAESYGLGSMSYRLATTVEEGAELAGVLLFIYVLFEYRDHNRRDERSLGGVDDGVLK